ncbi:MAG TPA: APC family permease, partial [Longimicrobiales bacterium]
ALAYSQIIKRFPYGGGGYVVATELLGPRFGVVSGSALLVDYVLTISVSIASGADQVFSVLPPGWVHWKVLAEAIVIALLVLMNLRGVKESVTILAPIFGLFLLLHAFLILVGIGAHAGAIGPTASNVATGFRQGLGTIGLLGMGAIFLRAYSMGAGTYTGIEAVSNGIQIMREPKVETARTTMTYMAISLSLTAGGILILYLLYQVHPQPGQTMNAVLLRNFIQRVPVGGWFVALTLASEAALLFVAAQAGFVDGPRVMSSMALDSWLPHRFSQISDRLSMANGVMLMGAAALLTLFYTKGDITTLVTMYSINVFVTFSLSQAGMLRFWRRTRQAGRKRGVAIHGVAFLLCVSILAGVLYEKFLLGGWVTVVVTTTIIALCFWFRSRYRRVRDQFRQLNQVFDDVPAADAAEPVALDHKKPTAVLFVGSYSGLGIHALLTLQKLFPGFYRNFLFVSIGVIDAATLHGVEEVDRLRKQTEDGLRRYVGLARKMGLSADYRMEIAPDALVAAEDLAVAISKEFPRAVFYLGKLVFQEPTWLERLLHNRTAENIQQKLQFMGLNSMILPARVTEKKVG